MLARIPAVGNAEAKVKVKVLEEATLEVVPLDHPEVVDGAVADRELHTGVCFTDRHTNSREMRGRESKRPLGSTTLLSVRLLTLHRRCAA